MYTNADELGPNQLYARTKLAVLLFTKYGLVERVLLPNGDRIWAAASHPGAVHTGQQDQFKEAYGETFGTILKHMTIPFMRNPEQGSLSTLYAATSEDVDKNSWCVTLSNISSASAHSSVGKASTTPTPARSTARAIRLAIRTWELACGSSATRSFARRLVPTDFFHGILARTRESAEVTAECEVVSVL